MTIKTPAANETAEIKALEAYVAANAPFLTNVTKVEALQPYTYQEGDDALHEQIAAQVFQILEKKSPTQIRRVDSLKALWDLADAEFEFDPLDEPEKRDNIIGRSIVCGQTVLALLEVVKPVRRYALLWEKTRSEMQGWTALQAVVDKQRQVPWLLIGADEVVWCPPAATCQIVDGVFSARWA
jgi:hypothetical protein